MFSNSITCSYLERNCRTMPKFPGTLFLFPQALSPSSPTIYIYYQRSIKMTMEDRSRVIRTIPSKSSGCKVVPVSRIGSGSKFLRGRTALCKVQTPQLFLWESHCILKISTAFTSATESLASNKCKFDLPWVRINLWNLGPPQTKICRQDKGKGQLTYCIKHTFPRYLRQWVYPIIWRRADTSARGSGLKYRETATHWYNTSWHELAESKLTQVRNVSDSMDAQTNVRCRWK